MVANKRITFAATPTAEYAPHTLAFERNAYAPGGYALAAYGGDGCLFGCIAAAANDVLAPMVKDGWISVELVLSAISAPAHPPCHVPFSSNLDCEIFVRLRLCRAAQWSRVAGRCARDARDGRPA